MSAPQEIVELVGQFSRRISEYRGSLYNETELRNEFVNPFFAALGWDMDNRQGLSGDLKEVKVEESIRVDESIKNPDYSFRLGRKLKFFVETKKPSINIEAGIYPAFQLRRYAWSASLKLSILTDFEEFAVYDCREAVCSIHHLPCYQGSPCHQFEQMGPEDDLCMMSDYFRKLDNRKRSRLTSF